MGRYAKTFHPSNASRGDLKNLAIQIENFMEVLEEVLVIPDKIRGSEKEIDAALKMSRKLVKKLKAGDSKVFKDFE